jgi:hypothetical protein
MTQKEESTELTMRIDQEETRLFKTDSAGALRPSNLNEAMRMAELLAFSGMVPKDYIEKPGSVLVAITMGAEVGLAPMQAIQNIAVINGRPSVWGDAMLAICRNHREWGGMEETSSEQEASCRVTRLERIGGRVVPTATSRTFSMEDAKRAGLAGKEGPWKTYPKRMLQMRARAFALRDAFTDVLKGLHSADEMSDAVYVEARDVTPAATAETSAEPTKKGAAGLKAKLDAKKGSTAPNPRVMVFLEALDSAATSDDYAAVKRDLDDAWGSFSKEEQKTISDACTQTIARLKAAST